MDEVNIDEFLREASSAIDDPDKLAMFIREKATIAVERFLVRRCVESLRLPMASIISNAVLYFSRTTCRRCQFRLRNASSVMDGY
jgi:hypothetical protein